MQYIPTAIQHQVEYCTERMTIKYCYIQKKTAKLLFKRNGMNDEYLVKAGMSRSMDISASLSKTSKNPKPVIKNNKNWLPASAVVGIFPKISTQKMNLTERFHKIVFCRKKGFSPHTNFFLSFF